MGEGGGGGTRLRLLVLHVMNPMKCTYACCCALNGIKNGVLPTMASTSERTAVSAVSDVERSKTIEQKGERGLERLTREYVIHVAMISVTRLGFLFVFLSS